MYILAAERHTEDEETSQMCAKDVGGDTKHYLKEHGFITESESG